jgi:hypothetical protein
LGKHTLQKQLHLLQRISVSQKTGEFFLYGSGNAASKYCEETAERMRSPGERIVPLTIKEAMVWVENYCDADTYIELFGEVEE